MTLFYVHLFLLVWAPFHATNLQFFVSCAVQNGFVQFAAPTFFRTQDFRKLAVGNRRNFQVVYSDPETAESVARV